MTDDKTILHCLHFSIVFVYLTNAQDDFERKSIFTGNLCFHMHRRRAHRLTIMVSHKVDYNHISVQTCNNVNLILTERTLFKK